jgi:hypothetical protein
MADPKPTTIDPNVADFAKGLGIDMSGFTPEEAKAKKSGIYTQVQTSRNMPDDLALVDKINDVFKDFYKRDATQVEIATYLPSLRNKYKSKDGTTKTTIKYTYKNGELLSTDYFTADNLDPKMWLTEQVKTNLLAGAQEVAKEGIPEGPIGKNFVEVKNFAARNGIMLSDQAAGDYATQIVTGKLSQDTVLNSIRDSAASAFPQLADKIKAGIDVKTLADPYIQSMSNILEIPYTSVDLFDPKIRGALAYTLPDGKLATKSIYDFEKELRQDPRWEFTKNGKKAIADSTLRVLQDFGIQG